jgi:hypothetical protein
VSAYYERLAEYARGHGIAAADAVEDVIPATGAFLGTAAATPSRLR